MPKYLALEWGAHEARVVVARSRATDVLVDDAFAVPLHAAEEPKEASGSTTDAGKAIKAALAEHGIGRCETLVAVGRASIELRMLSLPPSPEDELPELVRFQAMRTFATIGEDWPLDFIPLDTREDGSHNVLAAAISPELVAQIEQTCEACGLSPSRLVLRPFAAASLLRRLHQAAVSTCCLMVDLLTDEADLTVLADGQVAFTRTVRLGHGDISAALLGEIRRTIPAAHNQLSGKRVERICIFSDGDETHVALKTLAEQQLSLPVELINPFADLPLGRSLRGKAPEHPGRFAPLLGMVLDEASQGQQTIDFLHPRRKPEPASTRRRNLLLGATAATLVIAGLVLMLGSLNRLDSQISELQATSKGMDAAVERAQERLDEVGEVDAFTAGDVTWIDELHELSREFPPADQAIVTQLATLAKEQGGQLVLQGYVVDPSTIPDLEQRLRDERHRVSGTGTNDDQQRETYRWYFRETVTVDPQTASQTSAPAGPVVPQNDQRTRTKGKRS